MEKHLHIIDFTVPYPVTHGGLFDLFYKLPALQQQDVQIHLHCFLYNNMQQDILKQFCNTVHYYPRLTGHQALSMQLPYIVSSRVNEDLLQALLQNDYPILMEGVHSTYLLKDKRFNARKKFVRIHNIEHLYYRDLANASHSYLKKMYYLRESRLLKKYEASIVNEANAFWGVTHQDVNFFREQFHCTTIDYLPVYLPDTWVVKTLSAMGSYCLYQGDLSVSINEQAVLWLLKNVFSKIKIPFVIAGKNPSQLLQSKIYQYTHCCLVSNPTEKEMQDMIAKAHIHVIYAESDAGIKLKLLNALFNGRHCVANAVSIKGSELETLCHIASDADSFCQAIANLFNAPFRADCTVMRKAVLEKMFNNTKNAQQQVQWIWGE
ncbi:glycosyltransferase [Hydrotalea sp.]|uniref:glycosyltransferase n=1 Tax=Hydrotalea sp. TaxID=2881279 RepID=UPI00258E3347|nr:glycosyltransferase [Hydrotalea sp.]